MEAAGGSLSLHYRDMALMGGVEVLKKYPVIREKRNQCRKDILAYGPDALILVDYSGFNLPMARFAKKNGIRVFYYISPKLWAWASWRVKTVRRSVYRMFVILPFEVPFYKAHQVTAEYYGNPVLDSVEAFQTTAITFHDFVSGNHLNHKPIIALLAGSRKQEIEKLLPEMLAITKYYPEYQFVIAGAPSISQDFYDAFIGRTGVRIVFNQTYQLLANSDVAIVTSGTATLETALLKVPEVVVYKTSPLTYFIGNFFVKIKYFSLVNLILDTPAVKELLQKDLALAIRIELDKLLYDKSYRSEMLHNFDLLHKTLGKPGVSGRVAARMVELTAIQDRKEIFTE